MSLKSYALTTVDRVATFMGITTPAEGSVKYTVLENQINAVTEFIEDYLGFRVKKTAYSNEEYSTERGQILILNNKPIVAGETFTLEGRSSGLNEDDWETIDSQYYHVDNDSGVVYGAGGWLFSRSRNGYRVNYTAGYDFDNSNTYLSDTEGGGIEMAAWLLISTVYNRRQGGAGIKSEAIGDYKIVYARGMFENDDIEQLLDKYVNLDDQVGASLTPLQI